MSNAAPHRQRRWLFRAVGAAVVAFLVMPMAGSPRWRGQLDPHRALAAEASRSPTDLEEQQRLQRRAFETFFTRARNAEARGEEAYARGDYWRALQEYPTQDEWRIITQTLSRLSGTRGVKNIALLPPPLAPSEEEITTFKRDLVQAMGQQDRDAFLSGRLWFAHPTTRRDHLLIAAAFPRSGAAVRAAHQWLAGVYRNDFAPSPNLEMSLCEWLLARDSEGAYVPEIAAALAKRHWYWWGERERAAEMWQVASRASARLPDELRRHVGDWEYRRLRRLRLHLQPTPADALAHLRRALEAEPERDWPMLLTSAQASLLEFEKMDAEAAVEVAARVAHLLKDVHSDADRARRNADELSAVAAQQHPVIGYRVRGWLSGRSWEDRWGRARTRRLAFDGQGRLHLLSWEDIRVFDRWGRLVKCIPLPGAPPHGCDPAPKWRQRWRYMAVDTTGRIFLYDGAAMVARVTPEGALDRTWLFDVRAADRPVLAAGTDVAPDESGGCYLLVGDRLVHFGEDGRTLWEARDVHLLPPLAADRNGHCYAADGADLLEIAPDGTIQTRRPLPFTPYSMATDGKGTWYAIRYGAYRAPPQVVRLDGNLRPAATFREVGDALGVICYGAEVAAGSSAVAVLDLAHDRIFVLDPQGKRRAIVPLCAMSSFQDAHSIAVDRAGSVYLVAGTQAGPWRLMRYDPEARYRQTLFSADHGPGDYRAGIPRIALDAQDRILLVDGEQGRMIRFDKRGRVADSTPLRLPGRFVASVAVDDAGDVYVIAHDESGPALGPIRYSPDGKVRGKLRPGGSGGNGCRAVRLASGPQGAIYVLDSEAAVHVFERGRWIRRISLTPSPKPSGWWLYRRCPVRLRVGPDGSLYLLYDSLIRRYTPDGRLAARIKAFCNYIPPDLERGVSGCRDFVVVPDGTLWGIDHARPAHPIIVHATPVLRGQRGSLDAPANSRWLTMLGYCGFLDYSDR